MGGHRARATDLMLTIKGPAPFPSSAYTSWSGRFHRSVSTNSKLSFLIPALKPSRLRLAELHRGRDDPPSARWIVDGPNEQQRAAAPVFDRTEKRPVDDHLKRLRDCGGPYTGRRSGRGFRAFLIHRPVSRLKHRRKEEASGAGLTRCRREHAR